VAMEANVRVAEQKMGQLMTIRDKLSRETGGGISVDGWLKKYWKIQEERCQIGELKPKTLNSKKYPLSVMQQALGNKDITTIQVRDIIDILNEFKERGKNGMARVVRGFMSDVFL